MDVTISAAEFDAEHGGDGIIVKGWVYFSDGCYRELNPKGLRVTPTDPYRRAQFVVRYWQAKLNLAVEEFMVLKRNLLAFTKASGNQRHCTPPPDRPAVERLKSIQTKVQNFKQELQKAEENLENSKPREMVQREQVDAELRVECENVFAEIQSIEI